MSVRGRTQAVSPARDSTDETAVKSDIIMSTKRCCFTGVLSIAHIVIVHLPAVIHNAIINTGGDLSVSGTHGNRPWRIGIRHPRKEAAIAWLEASDNESVFTSGDYERYYMHKGKRYHHILDPRTGYPAQGSSSVTVIHDNAAEADAAATALFVAGPQYWHSIALSMGIRYVMLIDTEGTIHMNPAMVERIHFINDATPSILLSQPL